jgi:benzoylformate decarboxylase
MSIPSVRDETFRLLRDLGITTVFGNPGSTELLMFRDFPADFRYVLGLQESIVVGMADGYAQATRNAAFINLHSAVGVGHAMGNLFTAFRNRTPLVVTAGQQSRSLLLMEPFLYATQATELPRPYVKWSCEPACAQDVPAAIARAYYIAMQPPCGPAFVSVPIDDWDQPARPVAPRQVSRQVRASGPDLAALASALNDSRRPVFIVGGAVDRDGAWDDVVRLAERHGALVWASPLIGRCGFPEDHPLFAGHLPAFREEIARRMEGHDVLLALGAAVFTYHAEGHGPYTPEGLAVFQVTEDPDLAAAALTGRSLLASVGATVAELLRLPGPPAPAAQRGREAAVAVAATTPMAPAFVMQTLARVRARDAILVEESPSTRGDMQRHLPVVAQESFYTCASGGLGHGLPAAVGIALAKPGRQVIALLGDGSAMYSIQGLWSAAQLGLQITFVILNNGRYEALQHFAQRFALPRTVGTDLGGIDFVALAQSQGCRGFRVDGPDTLESTLRTALGTAGPTLVEVTVA